MNLKSLVLGAACASLFSAAFAAGSAYMPLEYVEATGTQYVDIGLVPEGGMTCEFDFMPTYTAASGVDQIYLGARNDSGDTRFYFAAYHSTYKFYYGYGAYTATYKPLPANERIKVRVEINEGAQTVSYPDNPDDVPFNGSNASSVKIVPTLTLFANHNGTSVSSQAQARCYGLKIWQGEELVRDMKPAARGGVAGMWDDVTQKFYPANKTLVVPEGAVIAPQTCTWSGAGNDGKWSTAANWDVPPVPGRGDVLVFPALGKDYAVTNDYDAFVAKQLQMAPSALDANRITLAGNEITLDYGSSGRTVTNACPVTFDAPIRFARTENANFGNPVVFNGAVTIDGASTVQFWSGIQMGATFNAPVYGPQATFLVNLGSAGGGGNAVFNAKVTVANFYNGRSYASGCSYFNVSSNDIGVISTVYSSDTFNAPNALLPTTVLTWNGYYRENYANSSTFHTNGEQQGDRLEFYAEHYTPVKATPANNVLERLWARDSQSTFTLYGSASAVTCARLDGDLSIVWNPRGDFTQTLRDRYNTCTGPFVVKGGTLRVDGTSEFPSLAKIEVQAGATFEAAATNGVTFAGLQRVELTGAGATFSIPAADPECPDAVNAPFPDGLAAFIAKDAKFRVGAGVSVTVGCLVYDGVRVAGGTYTAADVAWLEGDGSVVVLAGKNDVTFWTGAAGNGDWADDGNWSHGAPLATDAAYLYKNGEDVQMTIGNGATMPKTLYVRNETGTTKLTVAGKAAFANGRVNLEKGAVLDVPEGGELFMDGKAGGTKAVATGSADVLFSIAGGAELRVSGGIVTLTNWYGQAVVEGDANGAAKITLSAGRFLFSTLEELNCLYVRKGGEFKTTGGECCFSPLSGSWGGRCMLFRPDGGTVQFGGDTCVHLNSHFTFMPGTVRFTDRAQVKFASGNNFFYATAASDLAKVIFEDDATIVNNADGIRLGGGAGTSVWVHASANATAANVAYTAYGTWVGENNGVGIMELQRGLMKAGPRGVLVGACSGYAVNTSAEGFLNVTGGALDVTGNGSTEGKWGWGGSHPIGFVVGMNVYTNFNGPKFTGTCNLTAGAITNQSGNFIVGEGNAEGRFVQSAGDVNSGTQLSGLYCKRGEWSIVGVVGMAGGKGTYEMTGGTAQFNQNFFVGGILTNEVRLSQEKLSPYYDAERQDAEGRLVLAGGEFKALHDVVVGEAGEGEITVGGNGVFDVAGDLVLSNATKSVLKLVAGETGFGTTKVAGTLAVSDGAWLEVDLTDAPEKKCTFPLLTCGAMEGAFAAGQVTFKGPAKRTRRAELVRTETGLAVQITTGTVLVVK